MLGLWRNRSGYGPMTCGYAACFAERLRLSVRESPNQPSPRRPHCGRRTEGKVGPGAGKAEPFRRAERQSRARHNDS